MKKMIAQIVEEEIKATYPLSETTQQFIERVSKMVMEEIHLLKMYAPMGLDLAVLEEIQLEVLEVFRLKTYGYLSLQQYRVALLTKKTNLPNLEVTDSFEEQQST